MNKILAIYVFSPNMFFLIMIRILSLIHQFHSPKMLDIYQCYLEMVLRSTAVAILTLQIDGARTRNQENNSI